MLSLVLAKAIQKSQVIRKLVLAKALLLLLSVTAFCAVAPPTAFQSVLWEEHPPAYYTQHAEEWKAYVSNPCAEENAWVHYYKFAQYSNRFDEGDYDLNAIEKEAEAAGMPADGFALPYLKFANNNDPSTRYEQLLIAHKAQPDNPKPYTGLIAHYTLTNQIAKRDNILHKLQHVRPLPKGLLEYNYNQLESTAANAILLTNGDADTFPSWVLQTVFNHRTDVSVINWALLWYAPAYRAQVAADLGVDIEAIENPTAMMDALHKAGRPLYMAMTIDLNQFGDHRKDWLFVTGLAMRYERPGYKNLDFIKTAYSNNWRLDYLRQPLADNPEQAVTDELNRNYLPTLLELRDFYGNDEAKVLELNSLITNVAQRANVENVLSRITNGEANTRPRLASTNYEVSGPALSLSKGKREDFLSAKDIARNLVRIPAGLSKRVADPLAGNEAVMEMIRDGKDIDVRLDADLLMMDTEVSNEEYYRFVQDILLQKKNDYLDTIVAGKVDWATELFGDLTREVDTNTDDSRLPVVNLSHRAAQLYAQWLSEVYNDDPKRKDGQNVRFRLPTAEEWTYAAMGGHNYSPYPWGGNFTFNDKGCFLANFRTFDLPTEEREKLNAACETDKKHTGCKSETLLPVVTDAYFPNDYGMYNMVGNAAEMIDTPGITLGGSWLDTPEESIIGRSIQRKTPHASTGFRLVAEFYD
ncbi:MAG: SUMF1/EgtB/PvdO family nonheme iron enzyme [Saprospiraceae bacterium]